MDRKWWTLIAVCTGVFMLLLDITIVNVALPSIEHDLNASLSDLQWVIDAYALTLAALLLTAGSLADLLGRRLIFAIGIVIFTGGSALCGVSPSATFLALSLYQIESNTRSAAVLGFVGAGGIGLVYAENMRLWNWDVVMFITLILVVVVMIMDKVSSLLRNKYIIGEDIPLYRQKSQID